MNLILVVLSVVLLVVAGVLAAVAAGQRRTMASLRSDAAQCQARVREGEERVRSLIERATQAETTVAALKEKAESDRRELERLQASFRAEFRNLANDILEEKSKAFKQTNRESMEILLKPFRDNITEFRERVERIYSDENQQRGMLKSELRQLLELNARITQETNNLTAALKGNSKVQGDWGEMILETILQSSNLEKGVQYFTQVNMKDAQGNNQRPDVILNLPEGKQVVIDSKVSLTSFVAYTEASDDAARSRALREHIRSVRAHVEELAAKRYCDLEGLDSPDFVIMFVPNEPAFLTALQNDSSIWGWAYDKKVIVSSPTNLFALLKIVDDLWKRDKQSRNAIAIAEEGARLYDKFVGFTETLQHLGRSLAGAQADYENAMKQLSAGRGNLVARAEKMRALGLKASKSLAPRLTEDMEENERLPQAGE